MYKLVLAVLFFALFSPFAFADPSAEKLLAEGRVDEAIAALHVTIGSALQSAAEHNLLCRAYYTLGNWDAGLSACEKAISLEPANSRYHLWLGRIYGRKADGSNFLTAFGLARKVRHELETAVRLDPNDAPARTDLAEFYLEAPGIVGGGKDKAAEQAEKLASLDRVKAGWVRGRIAEKNKDFVAAEKEYLAAVEASHGRPDAWVNLARFYKGRGSFDKMDDAIQHAAAQRANRPEVLMDAAHVLINGQRNFPLAAELLRRYVAAGSFVEDAPAYKAHYLLGTLLEKQGDKQGAAYEYRVARGMAKSFSLAQEALDRVNRPSAGGQ